MADECSGGCQGRALCLHLVGRLTDASICPGRMCQQACGADPAPLVSVCGAASAWARGEPQRFAASNRVKRGFCAEYCTPLSCEAPDGLAIAAGAFDPPWRLPPSIQYGIDGKLPFIDGLHALPVRRTQDDMAAGFLAGIVSGHGQHGPRHRGLAAGLTVRSVPASPTMSAPHPVGRP